MDLGKSFLRPMLVSESANSPSEEQGKRFQELIRIVEKKRKQIKEEEVAGKKPMQIKEESAKSVEKRIEDVMRSKGTLPQFPAAVKGEKIPSDDASVASLAALGVKVYGLDAPPLNTSNGHVQWGSIAGYEQQKREIEDSILLALRSPQVYDDIARGTRVKFESNRPRAVLFEGPPGTGKTSCARVIATQSGIPLLYVPLEVIVSKWYGDSTRVLKQVFSLANKFPNGALIFFDEIDSFAGVRGERMHEVTRRILSVLLQEIDGFEQDKKVAVIGATNRKQDLDPALLSRFDSVIYFGLPDQQSREQIVAQFAKHLTEAELAGFATSTEGMSGRDIRDVCEKAERMWASKLIRGKVPIDLEGNGSLPPLEEYIESAMTRKKNSLP